MGTAATRVRTQRRLTHTTFQHELNTLCATQRQFKSEKASRLIQLYGLVARLNIVFIIIYMPSLINIKSFDDTNLLLLFLANKKMFKLIIRQNVKKMLTQVTCVQVICYCRSDR